MECPVCMDQMASSTTICGHNFCESCLSKVVTTSLFCPLCRGILLDETISIKVLNESILDSLMSVSKKKRNLYWKGFNKLKQHVKNGSLLEDEMGSEMISLLFHVVGESAKHFIKMEMLEAVLRRKDYEDLPYVDWRYLFIKA